MSINEQHNTLVASTRNIFSYGTIVDRWEVGASVTMTTATGEWCKGTVLANVASRGMRQVTIRWNRVRERYHYHIPSSDVRSVNFDKFILEV